MSDFELASDDRDQGKPKPIRRFPRLPRRFPRLPIHTETFYAVRCKSNGNFWCESVDEFMFMDRYFFEGSPLDAVRVDEGYFEEELRVIENWMSKGEFDASDFEFVKVDAFYTLSRPHQGSSDSSSSSEEDDA